MQSNINRIIRRPELLTILGISNATLYRMIEVGEFPKPIKLGTNSVGWKSNEVNQWIETRERV